LTITWSSWSSRESWFSSPWPLRGNVCWTLYPSPFGRLTPSIAGQYGLAVTVLEATGTEVVLNKINVNTEELAVAYKFKSSPTIRVNGHDIQIEVRESLCESCGDLCGDEVYCRVWVYQGNEWVCQEICAFPLNR